MNKISGKQLYSVAMIGEIFAIFCLHGSIGLLTAAGYVAASLIVCAVVMPFAWAYRSGKELPEAVEFLLLLLIIAWGGSLFAMQWSASEMIYIPYENHGISGKLLISGLIALVCLYISSTGIKSLGRAAVIAAAIGAVCLAVVIISTLSKHDWQNMRHNGNELTFAGEFVRGLLISGNAAAFIVLLGMDKGSTIFRTGIFFAVRAAVGAVVIVTTVLAVGDIMPAVELPAVMAARLAQPFAAQRIDSLFMIVFAVYAVFSIAVQSAAAVCLLGKLFPKIRRFRSLTVLTLMLSSALIINNVR
ncbi:MAG: hypothetical protein IIY35_01630 [Ruminococcus sp.]|nr:hypothetical protein [Ruminococcus sp.]